ncbi:MAG: carboxypeptidase-like regulatory domain-containing protein [Candidatus Dormibacteraeota bacterium]|nr:carboxypeptidase-like regulatory domain-containing protein [Candidatus Dormibacteraeota bacterium]
MKRLLGAVALAGLLAACGASPAASPTPGTGIRGVVTVGPTCPVERVNSPCPPRPMQATIDVRDASGKQVATVVSGSDGHFQADLLPGTYTLKGVAPGGAGLPRPILVTVTVVAGSYATVNVEFDSGIR